MKIGTKLRGRCSAPAIKLLQESNGMRKCIDSSKKSLIEMVSSLVVDVLHRQLKG